MKLLKILQLDIFPGVYAIYKGPCCFQVALLKNGMILMSAKSGGLKDSQPHLFCEKAFVQEMLPVLS
jgi:hypothetical protein